jgi:hypothetical protein
MFLIAIVASAAISAAPAAHAPVFSMPSASRPLSAPRPAPPPPPPPVRPAQSVAHQPDYPSRPLTSCFIQKREPGEDTIGVGAAPLSSYGPCPQSVFIPPF